MKSGFNANVPARKPRTRIGQVLTELTSDAEGNGGETSEDPASAPPDVQPEADNEVETESPAAAIATAAPARSAPSGTQVPQVPEEEAEAVRPEEARTPRKEVGPTQGQQRLAAGHDRVNSLRERLAAAARAPVTAAEPKRTAAAVLEVVEDLRARLDTAIQERSEMAETLDDVRAQLVRAETEAEKERKLRSTVEARRDESARIAEEAVTEAEALAAERDQVLSELAEQRRLDDEQAELLVEAEELIAQRDAERAAAAQESEDLRAQLERRAVEIADLESRLQSAAADRARIEARCRELETEVAELTEAREALEAIEATVNRRG
jgi:DNA repair exonuclease SbcCD ATPase subunit